MKSNDVSMYDALAVCYRDYSLKKDAYIKAVDSLVLANIPDSACSLLDVGAGDGLRGMMLARSKNIDYIVLAEPSSEMIARCKSLNPTEIWQVTAEELPIRKKFDVITCLWNVLGHISTRTARLAALLKFKDVLSKNGVLFIDVNNRHNARSYGWKKVTGRMIIDFLQPDEQRGDTTFEWKIGEATFPGMGHLFTPCEMDFLIRDSGLRLRRRVAVDYADGSLHRLPFLGQLLYILSK